MKIKDLVTNLHLGVYKFGFRSNCMVVDFSSTKQLNCTIGIDAM
jgi:hypothetical protein